MRKIKQGTAFNVARQYFMIDDISDLANIDTLYSCELGDIAELPSGDKYIRYSSASDGWRLMAEEGSGGGSGSSLQEKSVSISENNTILTIRPDSGYEGMSKLTAAIAVPKDPIVLQNKKVSFTSNQTVTIEADESYDGLDSVEVSVLVEGESVPEKDVNYIDYDGTIVASYTVNEFLELSNHPANPIHSRLTSQGWNWTLSDAKTYVNKYYKLWIGQMYITKSGNTEIDIELTNENLLSPYLSLRVNGIVDIDWGDESTKSRVEGNSISTNIYTPHTYNNLGKYTISIEVIEGNFEFGYFQLLVSATEGYNTRYNSYIKAIYIGEGMNKLFAANCYLLQTITIPYYENGFNFDSIADCSCLQSVTIPNGVTSLYSEAFTQNEALQIVSLPKSINIINTNIFSECQGLRSITLPDNITNIGSSCFTSCRCLCSLTVPQNVTNIDSTALAYMYGLYELKFKSFSPPVIANSNVFTSLPTDCIIYVPNGRMNVYKNSTNYPDPSVYTYVEE